MFKDSFLIKEVNYSSGVYISIVENKLYLALDWDQNLFEPSAFLTTNLVKSNIVNSIHSDLHLLNQLITEASLLDTKNA